MVVDLSPLRPEDCPEIPAFLARAVPDSWQTTPPADDAQCRRMLAASGCIAIVARAGGAVVGLAAGWVFPSVVGQGDTVMLDELLVAPSHRGTGIGTALVAAFTRTARQQAQAPIELWATTDFPDEPAATPFKRTGGTQGGLLRQFDWPQEACA